MSCTECSTVEQLVNRAAGVLDDLQFVRWSKATLIDYLNEALCTIHGLRPDAFATTEVFPLHPGAVQDLPAKYSSLVGLLSNVDIDQTGSVVEGAPISESDDRYSRIFAKKPCLNSTRCPPATGAYSVRSFTRDKIDKSVFTVYPPVPVGTHAAVRASVINAPRHFCETDFAACLGVECSYDASLISWMLMRAYETDTESPSAINNAERHRKSFYDMFNTEYLQAQRFTSGQYLGMDAKRPGADPAFRQK